MGVVGQLLALDLKSISRNRNARAIALISVLLIPGSLVAYHLSPDYHGNKFVGMLIYFGILSSGSLTQFYGRHMFGWESSYFDGLIVRNLALRQIILSKLILLQGSCASYFVTGWPLYYFAAPDSVPLFFAFMVYNAGFVAPLVVLSATSNRRRIELSGNLFFTAGTSGLQSAILTALVMISVPLFVSLVFLQSEDTGLRVLAAIGVASLVCTRFWVQIATHRLAKRRYEMAEGFRLAAS